MLYNVKEERNESMQKALSDLKRIKSEIKIDVKQSISSSSPKCYQLFP